MKGVAAVAVSVCSMLLLLTLRFIGAEAFYCQDRVMAVVVLRVVNRRA